MFKVENTKLDIYSNIRIRKQKKTLIYISMFKNPEFSNKLFKTFKRDYDYALRNKFFRLSKEQFFNERYFQSILIKSLLEFDNPNNLIIPEMPYPKNKSKRMDIFIQDYEDSFKYIEVKYFREPPGGGGQTEERGRFYADFCKLALLSEEQTELFLFFIFDQNRWDYFSKNSFHSEFDSNQSLITENGNIRDQFTLTYDLLCQGNKVDTIRKTIEGEIGSPIKFKKFKVKIEQLFKFKHEGFFFLLLQFEPKII
ncbi:hypothetical protein LCGC14_1543580 [marine sediment metagenome]|uniref:Uncharacterized protein n=1 Tax=marine sediment metagenome TaxID=412755 RepID=A0A0F9ISE9_9ZZZZ